MTTLYQISIFPNGIKSWTGTVTIVNWMRKYYVNDDSYIWTTDKQEAMGAYKKPSNSLEVN